MDENGVWFENRNSDQQFHHIYQISDDQVNVFELDTFIIGNSSDFNIIDTRIIISNNRIIALVDAISTNFVSFSVTELDAYHFAAYVLGKNKIDRIILHENSVDYLDMKDIMYEQDIPVIIFRHSNSGNTVYNIYRFTDDILVKDEDLENKLSTIKNDLQANRIGGFYRSDAVITIWEKFNELESNHFVLYFFADDQYFATLN